MAVAVDNTGAAVGGTSLTTKTLTSFAVGAGANRLLYVGVSQWAGTDVAPTGNFNTTETLTVHDAHTHACFGGTQRSTILRRIAPSNVTANIVINWASTADEVVIGATSWTGADQTTPLGTAVKASGTVGAPATGAVTNASGDAVHGLLAAAATSAVGNTSGQTARWDALAASSTTEGAGSSTAGTGSGISMTWTANGSNSDWTAIGVKIAQVSAAGVSTDWMTEGRQDALIKHTLLSIVPSGSMPGRGI